VLRASVIRILEQARKPRTQVRYDSGPFVNDDPAAATGKCDGECEGLRLLEHLGVRFVRD
jgi:hypothetical protein